MRLGFALLSADLLFPVYATAFPSIASRGPALRSQTLSWGGTDSRAARIISVVRCADRGLAEIS